MFTVIYGASKLYITNNKKYPNSESHLPMKGYPHRSLLFLHRLLCAGSHMHTARVFCINTYLHINLPTR